MWLKQSSTGTFVVGPFVDITDGYTPKTAITIAQADVRLSKNGSTFAQKNEATSATHVEAGYYSIPYNSTDTNTLGRLKLAVNITGTALPVWTDFMVLPANVFNSIVWNTEVLGVNALNTGTVSTIANNIGTPVALDGGSATLSGMLTKFADDNNGTTYDATSDSLRGLATSIAASAPVSSTAITGTATVGTVVSGNFSNTWTQNSVYWQIRATGAAAIDAQLTYSVGTGKLANTLRIIGRYQVAAPTTSKFVSIQAYNYKTLSYDTISSTSTRINGQTASTDNTYTYALTVDHLSVAGVAIIRFVGSDITATSDLYLDYVPYLYQVQGTTTDAIAQAVYLKMKNTVYDGGVYIDTVGGVAGTVIGDNGTAWNPVSTLVDALTIANSLGVKRLYFKPDSEITLNQSFANWRFIGRGRIHLGNQDISDAWFQDLEFVDGLSTGSDAIFQSCIVGSGSFYPTWFDRCALNGSVTMLSAGEYTFERCYDGSPSTTINPTFIFSSGVLAGIRGWNGGLTLSNMVAGNYATIEGMGRAVINSNCSGGNITIRGFFPAVTDNVPGGFAGTLTDTQRYGEDQNTYAITNGWVSITGSVTLGITQPAITWGQQKIVANVNGEGALDIRNNHLSGYGLYNEGGETGLYNQGGSWGNENIGTNKAGQSNVGNTNGQQNTGGVGQKNTGITYGQHNISDDGLGGGSVAQYNEGVTIGQKNVGYVGQSNVGNNGNGVEISGSDNALSLVGTAGNGINISSGSSPLSDDVITSSSIATDAITSDGLATSAAQEIANLILSGYMNVTGTVNAIVIGYVQVTGTVNSNVTQWNGSGVVSGAIPSFAAGTAGGIPIVDLNNYIAGIQGTKNQLDDLNDIAAGTQMDLVSAPNGTAITAFTNDIFGEVVEGTTTFKRWIRRMGAALFGKASGGGVAGSKKFRDTTDAVNRIDATTDANGNRTSVTFDDTDT